MTVLIVAGSDQMQEGLQILLSSLADVHVVETEESTAVSAAIVRYRPHLCLLDSAHPEQAMELLAYIRSNWPQIRCIALVDAVHQQETARQAGAHVVLIKGFPAAKLYALVKQLLTQ